MDPDQYPPKPPYDPGHPPPDQVPWHSITPAQDPHSPYTGPDMRAMAETFADALATRLAPEPAKPRQVSLQWLRDWLSSPTGRQFIVSALTTGPIGGAALARFTEDTPDAAPFGMVALAFIGFGLVHLAYHKWWSVLLVWGAALSPVYYPPALLSAITMLTGAAS
ncbi:hypothetical protein OG730_41905 (plasmid) [Streptomyces sp. NBC_01298]|uniref:hypothetical protein n=1 Tax=Streptomyces sp. NBC_01298 TaxID=2903817 RepID=UPI002E10D3EE|nr:hypothetical protein OG730_41905 [Streptomyces sp. NBC_01298]